MRIPIELTEQNRIIQYNLETQLKEKGLMNEKGYRIVPLSDFVSEDRQRGRIKEISSIRPEYEDLSELEIAILMKLWFLEGTLTKQEDRLILEYYI